MSDKCKLCCIPSKGRGGDKWNYAAALILEKNAKHRNDFEMLLVVTRSKMLITQSQRASRESTFQSTARERTNERECRSKCFKGINEIYFQLGAIIG